MDYRSVVAEEEKAALALELESRLGLLPSAEKTLVTPVTSTMRFSGPSLPLRAARALGSL